MATQGSFFSGQVKIEVLLNRAGFGGQKQGEVQNGGQGGVGGGGMGGGGHRHGGGGGYGSGGSAFSSPSGEEGSPAIRMRESTLPPVRLHVRLTNRSPRPAVVSVTNFDSDLGNFVVQPERLSLPPGQSAETDPMTSRLGVTSDEIPIKVSLQLDGRRETQILTLRIIKESVP